MAGWPNTGGLLLLLGLGLGLPGRGAVPSRNASQSPRPTAPAFQPNAKYLKDFAKLEEKAAKQQGHDQAETLAKMAELDYELAAQGYAAHQTAFGIEHLDSVVQLADRSFALLQAESQRGQKDGMKNVEVSLQKITFGLRGLGRQMDLATGSKIEATLNHLSDLRGQLLLLMFAPKVPKGAVQ